MTQPKGKKQNTAAVCAELAAATTARMGLLLWDVVFEKEGAGWYLRYLIDKEDGSFSIADCEAFSREISDLLDAADPIEQSYTLEVSSPGIERKLTKDWHFLRYIGQQVLVRLIRPVEGEREFVGALAAYGEDGTVSVDLDEETRAEFAAGEIAYVRLYADF